MEIEMRTGCDCMVACLAMLMGWTYEEAAEYFPLKAVKETGYMWDWLIPYLRDNEVHLVCFVDDLIKYVDWTKPSIVTVPSLTCPEIGDHVIFWNEKKVIDPSTSVKYKELPKEIIRVYQRRRA